jgi:hypothetical protein
VSTRELAEQWGLMSLDEKAGYERPGKRQCVNRTVVHAHLPSIATPHGAGDARGSLSVASLSDVPSGPSLSPYSAGLCHVHSFLFSMAQCFSDHKMLCLAHGVCVRTIRWLFRHMQKVWRLAHERVFRYAKLRVMVLCGVHESDMFGTRSVIL